MSQFEKADTFFAYLQATKVDQNELRSPPCLHHQHGFAVLQEGVEFTIESVEALYLAIDEFTEGISYNHWHTVLGVNWHLVVSSQRLGNATRTALSNSLLPGCIYVDRATQEHLRASGLHLKMHAAAQCDERWGFVSHELTASDCRAVEREYPIQVPEPVIRWLTPFFGRAQEIRTVRTLLQRIDQVTVTGAKGIGKSRLCHIVGMREHNLRRVITVRLGRGELESPVDFNAKIQQALSQVTPRSPHIRPEHPSLVVVDFDCGQLDYCADLIRALQSCDSPPKILCASRTPIGLPGERVVELGGLETPASDLNSLAKLSERDLLNRLFELSGMRLYLDRLERIGGSRCLNKQSMLASARTVTQTNGNPSKIEREAIRAAAAHLLSDGSDAKGGSAALREAHFLIASEVTHGEAAKLFDKQLSTFIKEQLAIANKFHLMLDGEHFSDGMTAFDNQYLTIFSAWALAAIESRPEALEFSALLAPYIQRRRPLPEARELLAVSLEIASRVDSPKEASAALAAAGILTTAGESSNAQALTVQSARLAARAGNALILAMAEANLALHHKRNGRMYLAALFSLVSATWMHGQKDLRRAAGCMNNLGAILDEVGCLESAKTLYEFAASFARTSLDQWTEAWTRINLAEIALRQNRIADSLREYAALALMAAELGDHRMLATSVEGFALAAAREQGLESTAIVCAGWADHIRSSFELPSTPKRAAELSKMLAAIRGSVGFAIADSLFEIGEKMTETEALSTLEKSMTPPALI